MDRLRIIQSQGEVRPGGDRFKAGATAELVSRRLPVYREEQIAKRTETLRRSANPNIAIQEYIPRWLVFRVGTELVTFVGGVGAIAYGLYTMDSDITRYGVIATGGSLGVFLGECVYS